MDELINKIKLKISLNNINEALLDAMKLTHESDFADELIIIQQRFNNLEKAFRIGIVTIEEHMLETSKISNSTLQIVNSFLQQISSPYNKAIEAISACEKYRLESINLSDLGLKFLPKEVLNLKNQILNLDISKNKIEVLPEWIGEFRKLVNLDVSNNKLKSIPSQIGNLVNLLTLELSGNNFNYLPEGICELEKLEELHCHDVDLKELPWCLFHLADRHALKYLYLGYEMSINISEEALDSANALYIMIDYSHNKNIS